MARPDPRENQMRSDPHFTGRLWCRCYGSKQTKAIVNNESADIVRMLNSAFAHLAERSVDLYPEECRAEIDSWNERIYPNLNNGVYRAGFATTQETDEAFGGRIRDAR